MTSYDTLLVLARLILPVELLDCFDIVEIENDAEMLTIHLDEQNLPPLSPTVHSLESKGFLGSVVILGGLIFVTSIYAYTFASLKRKNLISTTPLNDALNALILSLNASAAAFVLLFTKKFKILS